MPDPSIFQGLSTRRERLAAVEGYFADRKKLIVGRLSEMKDISVKDLTSSNTLIVTAPEEIWLTLMGKDGLFNREGVRIHYNQSLSVDRLQK